MRPSSYHVFVLLFPYITLIKGDISSENEAKTNAQGDVYSDIIKNITRVNNVLADLIKNYEMLKEIYKSEETFEKDYSLDTDTDELYKKNKKINRSVKKTTTKKPGILATQMFISDEEYNKEKKVDKIKKNKRKTKKVKIKKEPKKSKDIVRTPKKVKIQPVQNKVKERERVPNVEYLKEKSNEVHLNDSGIQTDYFSDENSYIEEDSEETEHHLKLEQKPQDIKPETQDKPITYTVKRYELTDTQSGGKINAIRDKTIKVSLVNDSKPVWKIIRSEDFTNIWDEIRNNNPINLKKENETMYNNYRASIEPDDRYPYTTKTEIMANNRRIVNFGTRKKFEMHSKESVEFNRTIEKDQFKTSILRTAYGDACLKVVVRKCFKACKQARKSVCHHYHCKKKFKSVFKNNSISGCIKEFKDATRTTLKDSTYYLYRAKVDTADVNLDNGFRDVTRSGYLAGVCLPNKLRTAQKLPKNSKEKELNILRDRFEHACQKASSNKCFHACKWAINNTCNTVSCNGRMQKTFRTACKKECKNSYHYVDKSDSSNSYSDTESSSSSNSDSSDDRKSSSEKENGNKKQTKKDKDKIKEEIKAKIMELIKKKKAEGKEVNVLDYFEKKEKKEDGYEDTDETEDEKKKVEKVEKRKRKKVKH